MLYTVEALVFTLLEYSNLYVLPYFSLSHSEKLF